MFPFFHSYCSAISPTVRRDLLFFFYLVSRLEEFKALNPPLDLVKGAEIEITIRGDILLYKNAVGGVGTIRSEVFTAASKFTTKEKGEMEHDNQMCTNYRIVISHSHYITSLDSGK